MNTIFQATEHPIVVERTADFWGHYHSLLAVPSCSPLGSSQTLLSFFPSRSYTSSFPSLFHPAPPPPPGLHHVQGWLVARQQQGAFNKRRDGRRRRVEGREEESEHKREQERGREVRVWVRSLCEVHVAESLCFNEIRISSFTVLRKPPSLRLQASYSLYLKRFSWKKMSFHACSWPRSGGNTTQI